MIVTSFSFLNAHNNEPRKLMGIATAAPANTAIFAVNNVSPNSIRTSFPTPILEDIAIV